MSSHPISYRLAAMIAFNCGLFIVALSRDPKLALWSACWVGGGFALFIALWNASIRRKAKAGKLESSVLVK